MKSRIFFPPEKHIQNTFGDCSQGSIAMTSVAGRAYIGEIELRSRTSQCRLYFFAKDNVEQNFKFNELRLSTSDPLLSSKFIIEGIIYEHSRDISVSYAKNASIWDLMVFEVFHKIIAASLKEMLTDSLYEEGCVAAKEFDVERIEEFENFAGVSLSPIIADLSLIIENFGKL
jgi:hypothetical protein